MTVINAKGESISYKYVKQCRGNDSNNATRVKVAIQVFISLLTLSNSLQTSRNTWNEELNFSCYMQILKESKPYFADIEWKLELIIILPIFPQSSHPTVVCFFPVGLSSLIHYQQVLWVLKFLLSPGLGSWQFIWIQDQQPRPSNKQNLKKPTITIISYFNSNCQLPKPEETSAHTRPIENVLTTKGLQERNIQLLDVTTVEK